MLFSVCHGGGFRFIAGRAEIIIEAHEAFIAFSSKAAVEATVAVHAFMTIH